MKPQLHTIWAICLYKPPAPQGVVLVFYCATEMATYSPVQRTVLIRSAVGAEVEKVRRDLFSDEPPSKKLKSKKRSKAKRASRAAKSAPRTVVTASVPVARPAKPSPVHQRKRKHSPIRFPGQDVTPTKPASSAVSTSPAREGPVSSTPVRDFSFMDGYEAVSVSPASPASSVRVDETAFATCLEDEVWSVAERGLAPYVPDGSPPPLQHPEACVSDTPASPEAEPQQCAAGTSGMQWRLIPVTVPPRQPASGALPRDPRRTCSRLPRRPLNFTGCPSVIPLKWQGLTSSFAV